jgi:hypothetical protein
MDRWSTQMMRWTILAARITAPLVVTDVQLGLL